jgi:hypothetical protein
VNIAGLDLVAANDQAVACSPATWPTAGNAAYPPLSRT